MKASNLLFTKNLTSMVKGIRAAKENKSEYISKCLGEIKDELKQNSTPEAKAVAIEKLIYVSEHTL